MVKEKKNLSIGLEVGLMSFKVLFNLKTVAYKLGLFQETEH